MSHPDFHELPGYRIAYPIGDAVFCLPGSDYGNQPTYGIVRHCELPARRFMPARVTVRLHDGEISLDASCVRPASIGGVWASRLRNHYREIERLERLETAALKCEVRGREYGITVVCEAPEVLTGFVDHLTEVVEEKMGA